MANKTHILLVEDEPGIADVVQFALETEGFLMDWSVTLEQARTQMRQAQPDFVLLDVGLPDGSGFDFCKEIRNQTQSAWTPVLFLTARQSEIDRILGLELGADDYLTKPFSPRELVARVRAILRRTRDTETLESAENVRLGDLYIQTSTASVTLCNQSLVLTPTEFRLLRHLATRPGQVFNRTQLMQATWEVPESALERTVDAHLKTLRRKLAEADPHREWIITRRGFGFTLQEPM